jgi:hypothetical protein
MATKKAAKKSGAKKAAKKGAKKSTRKAAVGITSVNLACIRKCHDTFIRCLQTTHNFKLCATQYQVCIRRCLNLK